MRNLFITSLIASLLGLNNAFACEGKTTIFEDSFSDDSGGWASGSFYSFEDGQLKIKLDDKRFSSILLNANFPVKSADFCVEFNVPLTNLEEVPGIGLTLFFIPWQEFYSVAIYSDVILSVSKYLNKQYINIYNIPAPTAEVRPGGKNILRVTTTDTNVTIYVNGTQIKTFRVQAPKQETNFGIIAARKKPSVESVISVKHFKVTSKD